MVGGIAVVTGNGVDAECGVGIQWLILPAMLRGEWVWGAASVWDRSRRASGQGLEWQRNLL